MDPSLGFGYHITLLLEALEVLFEHLNTLHHHFTQYVKHWLVTTMQPMLTVDSEPTYVISAGCCVYEMAG